MLSPQSSNYLYSDQQHMTVLILYNLTLKPWEICQSDSWEIISLVLISVSLITNEDDYIFIYLAVHLFREPPFHSESIW